MFKIALVRLPLLLEQPQCSNGHSHPNICLQSLFSPGSSRYILQSHESEFFRHHIYPMSFKRQLSLSECFLCWSVIWLTEVEEFQKASISYWSLKSKAVAFKILVQSCPILPCWSHYYLPSSFALFPTRLALMQKVETIIALPLPYGTDLTLIYLHILSEDAPLPVFVSCSARSLHRNTYIRRGHVGILLDLQG